MINRGLKIFGSCYEGYKVTVSWLGGGSVYGLRSGVCWLAVICALLLLSGAMARVSGTELSVARGNNLERMNQSIYHIGVGQAYVADVVSGQGGAGNPAGLSRRTVNQFSVEYQRFGEGWDLVSSGLVRPLRGGGSGGMQFAWLDYGELRRDYDTQLYRPQGTEFKAGISYSQQLTADLAVGLSGNLLTAKLGLDAQRETDYSLDAGALYRVNPGLWIGLVGRNLGGSLEIEGEANKLPEEFRVGFARYLFENRVSLTGDLVYIEPGAGLSRISGGAAGMRVTLVENLRIALGYRDIYEDESGFTGAVELFFPGITMRVGYLRDQYGRVVRMGGTVSL